jgi:hypothetical protein
MAGAKLMESEGAKMNLEFVADYYHLKFCCSRAGSWM